MARKKYIIEEDNKETDKPTQPAPNQPERPTRPSKPVSTVRPERQVRQPKTEEDVDDFIFEEDDFTFDFEDDTEPESKPEKPARPAKQERPAKQPKSQAQSKPKKKTKHTMKTVRIAIAGVLLIGITISLFIFKPEKDTSTILSRLDEQSGVNIKQASSDINEDIKELMKLNPYSRTELKGMLIELGHSEAQAEDGIQKASDEVYNEEEQINKRIDIYLKATGFSSKGLAGRLIADGFDQRTSMEVLARKSKEIDYAEQAKKRGYSYLEYHVVSDKKMREALKEDGFTDEAIEKAIKELPCDKGV